MSTPETLCSGCGATVNFQMGRWRDSAGQSACSGRKVGMLCSHYVKDQSLLDYPAIPDYIQDPIVFRDVVLGTALVGTLHDEQWVCRVVNGSWVTVRRTNSADPLFIEALNKKSVELPPVAIAPEPQHTPKWETNKIIYPAGQDVSFEVLDESGDIVCQTIMREVEIEKERIAIDAQRVNLFAAAPDMLSALKAIKELLGENSPYAIHRTDGALMDDGEALPIAAIFERADAAISKAEDFMEEARRTR